MKFKEPYADKAVKWQNYKMIKLSDKNRLEESLFYFLLSVREGRPRAKKGIVARAETLKALYTRPNPDLCTAIQHCLDAFLIELSPDPGQWGSIHAPASVLGLALAAHNCLYADSIDSEKDKGEFSSPVQGFTAALAWTIPPALTRDEQLAYHAVLRGTGAFFPNMGSEQKRLFSYLLELSPLTQLVSLDIHMPYVLNEPAAQILPGWKQVDNGADNPAVKAWKNTEKWIGAWIYLLDNESLARWLRHAWLEMPETMVSCRNIGLVLDILRKKNRRDFVLTFYEAYDRLYALTRENGRGAPTRDWPILETIAGLLRAPGNNEVALQINRRGNAYFLKFLPLVQIVIAENGIPPGFALLSNEFVSALRPLLEYTSYGVKQRISFGKITYQSD